MAQIYPIVLDVPTVLGSGLRKVSMGSELRFFEVSASLFALTTGPFTIRARRALDNSVLGSITFNAAGAQVFEGLDAYIAPADGVLIDCTAVGTGAQICTLTLWGIVPNT